MSEHVGDNSEDPMLRPLRDIAGSMGVPEAPGDNPYADALRAEGDKIIDSLPTRDNPVRSSDMGDLGAIVGDLTGRILAAKIHYAVAEDYPTPRPPEAAPTSENRAGVPPEERSRGATCSWAANHPRLAARDRNVAATNRGVERATGDLNDRALAMRERSNAETHAVAGVLQVYGVERDAMQPTPVGNGMTFKYAGNQVRVTTMNGVTDIVAWRDDLSPEEGTKLWEDHDRLVKEGATLAHINHYLEKGAIPPHLSHLARQLEADHGSVAAAFEQHAADVRAHAMSGGFRQFQVHSPQLRLGLPVAMHILEQYPEETYDIIGDYSATNGFIAVDRPGAFHMARRNDDGWVVTENGLIAPAA